MTARNRLLASLSIALPRPGLLPFTIALLYAALVLALNYSHSDAEWVNNWYPAARALWQGQSPYAEQFHFFNPPWALFLFAPLGLLPSQIGEFIFISINFGCFVFAAVRLGASHRSLFAFMLSLPVFYSFLLSNVDGIALVGLFLNPTMGLFFVLLKPQVGLGIAIYWFLLAWRQGGIRPVVKTFAPVCIALALSVVLFGPWYLASSRRFVLASYLAPFPLLVPVGILLLFLAWRKRDIRFSIPAGLCFSPYNGVPSWSAAMLPLVKSDRWMIIGACLSWLPAVAGYLISR